MTQTQKKESQQERADRLVTETREGYSFNRYADGEWKKAILMLIRLGLTDRNIVAIMLSKWTRWAADHKGRNEGAKAADLNAFIHDANNFRNGGFANEVKLLTAEHFQERN